ncbi:MAG TPA: hypothetical protein VF666_16960 [Pyrinomonadaceae bacterium]|jgi:hypothetical protein
MSEVNDDDINAKRSDELNRSGGSRFPSLTRLAVYFGLLVIAFLAGFIPMWINARENAKERDTAQRELRLSRMENALAAASLDARRGEYEPARQATSTFFNALDAEIKRETDSAITAAQRTNVERFNAQRDEIITLLARNDAASADRLLDMHVAFRNAVKSAPPAP